MDKTRLTDPKLREAYERIVGKSLPHIAAPTPSVHKPVQPHTIAEQHPSANRVKPGAPSFFNAQSVLKDSPAGREAQNLYTLLIIGFVLFFLIYTLFWVKYFGVVLPFSIPFVSE